MDKLRAYAWQIVAVTLALLLVVQTVRIEGFLVWPISHKGLKLELKEARDELAALTAAGKQMRGEATRTITRWRERKVYVNRAVRQVEDAPLPGNCRTPDLVLESVE